MKLCWCSGRQDCKLMLMDFGCIIIGIKFQLGPDTQSTYLLIDKTGFGSNIDKIKSSYGAQ